MSHTCHAMRCKREVPPKMLMCREHWSMVPVEIQERVWEHYRPGQEQDKRPTGEYMRASMDAIKAVMRAERGNN